MKLLEWVKQNRSLIKFYFKNHDLEIPDSDSDLAIEVRNNVGLRNTAVQVGVKFNRRN